MRIVSLSSIWNEELAPLLDRGLELLAVDPDDAKTLEAALADAHVVISAKLSSRQIRACKQLRLLICPAAGTDLIDRAALPGDVQFVKGSGHEIPMAEYVIGCLVALRQHLLESDAALRQGHWKYGFLGDSGLLDELHGSALGMIGFGGIAQAVARRALAFGMRCAAVTLHPDTTRAQASALEFLGGLGDAAQVDRLVSWSDALVLCCELSEITRGILDARRFELMKRGAVVVNIARGPVAREKDFYDALASGRIAGAAIDVWYQYPPEASFPSELPFQDLRNVIMTPHSSAWTEPTKRRRVAAIAAAINDFARGSKPV